MIPSQEWVKVGDGQPSPVAVDSALHKEMYLDRDSGFWAEYA